LERGVFAEEELREETQPSPSVVNAGDLINFISHPNGGISPGLGRLWRLALTTATPAMNQVLAKQTVSRRGVRYDDDINMAGTLTYLSMEGWTKTMHDEWGLPSRSSAAKWSMVSCGVGTGASA
jgi:hypothetical protein